MPARNRWSITNLFRTRKPRPAARRPVRVKTRFLRVEWLEPRRLLTDDYASLVAPLLAVMTPDPHPSGDLPANLSQVVPLAVYTAAAAPPDSDNPYIEPYVLGVEAIFSAIAANTTERPAVWGQNVPAAPHEFRLHLDDNGMLIQDWTIDWGDGSDPQTVSPQPWVIHQYPAAGEYTISVTADSPDGTFSASSSSWVDTVGIGGGGGGDGGLQVTLGDSPPTLHVGGPQTVAQGQTFALDSLADFSDPNTDDTGTSFTYSIDWGDGTPMFNGSNVDVIALAGVASADAPFLGALASDTADGPLTHVYTAAGDYDLAVTVTSNTSGLSDTQTIPIDVVQLAPTISSTYTSGNEGTPDSFTANLGSTPLTDPVAWQWQVLDSSGDVLASGTDPTLDYTFTAPDTYTVLLTATVDNVTSAPAVQTVTVDNVAPSFVGSIPSVTLGVGQTYSIPDVAFTDVNPNDTHTATVDWGDGSPLDTGATVTEETFDGTTTTPGTITDSYAYSAAGGPYTGTVTITDSEGLSTSETFSVTVDSPTVALTGFGPESGADTNLEVDYTVAGGTAAPFNIEIYTSSDGTTPGQLLMTQHVDGSANLPLGSGMDMATFPASFDDVPGDYHLIAVSDACSNTVEFAGGVFSATSVTASPPQTTLYVFGSAGSDSADIYGPGDSPSNTVVFDSTDYAIGWATAIHVVGENGALTATADNDVTLPIAMDGGSGNDTFTGGKGNDTITGGTGTNVIQSSNGVDSPQIVDDTDTGAGGVVNKIDLNGAWSPLTIPGAFDGEEQVHAKGSGADDVSWTFDDLDPSAYYNLYVTWTPISEASSEAQYTVKDDGTIIGTPAQVNQTQPPADFQAAGEYWHDLGVYQASSQALVLLLDTDNSGEVLADAAMIVPATTPPLTNLVMNNFGVDADGNLSVTYTVNGEDAPPFSIGIYQSADGIHPGALAGTIDVSDPADLSGGGTEHTLTYQDSLNGLAGAPYYIAQLDAYDDVVETTKADNTSTAPLTGVYEDASGSLYVLAANDYTGHSIVISEDSSTGDVSVTLDSSSPQTFEDVASIYVAAYQGANTIDAAGIDLPLYFYGGDGSEKFTGGDGGNTIYGGTAGGNVIYAGAGTDTIYGQGTLSNTIYGGSGTDTIYAGAGGDTIIGGPGNAEIYGGAGNDVLRGGSGNNWIQAGSGNATITGGPGNDWLIAGSGNDLITGGSGTEVIKGGSGTDTLIGGSGLDDIYGGSGTNFIYGNGVHDILQGGSGSDFIEPNASGGSGLASIQVKDSNDNSSFDGNIDANGNADTGDYKSVLDPGYGGVMADWEFDNLTSDTRLGENTTTPFAVYVNWQNGANPGSGNHWSDATVYSVYDNSTLLGSVTVDQQDAPDSVSPMGADRPWQLLGVWNIPTGDQITVELVNYDVSTGSVICLGDAMIYALWPTVSLRPTNVTVNPLVPSAYAGNYVDWMDACAPVAISVAGAGAGALVPLQLLESVSSLYYLISGATSTDWQAVFPNVPGLEFFTSASGTTQLTPDGNGNLIVQAFTSGAYSTTVYAAADPTSPLAQTAAAPTQLYAYAENTGTPGQTPNGAKVAQNTPVAATAQQNTTVGVTLYTSSTATANTLAMADAQATELQDPATKQMVGIVSEAMTSHFNHLDGPADLFKKYNFSSATSGRTLQETSGASGGVTVQDAKSGNNVTIPAGAFKYYMFPIAYVFGIQTSSPQGLQGWKYLVEESASHTITLPNRQPISLPTRGFKPVAEGTFTEFTKLQPAQFMYAPLTKNDPAKDKYAAAFVDEPSASALVNVPKGVAIPRLVKIPGLTRPAPTPQNPINRSDVLGFDNIPATQKSEVTQRITLTPPNGNVVYTTTITFSYGIDYGNGGTAIPLQVDNANPVVTTTQKPP